LSGIAPTSLQLRGRVGYIAYKNLEISNTGLALLGVNLNLIVPSVGPIKPSWSIPIPARKKAFIPIGWLCLQPGILNAQLQIKANNDPTFTTITTIPVTIECLPEITLSLTADATSLSSGATTGVHASMTNDVDHGLSRHRGHEVRHLT
jgi:hypothetical protein